MQNIILSHSGKQHSYQVGKALHAMGLLQKFYTSSYISSSLLQKRLLKQGNQYWTRRFVEGLSGSVVDANWRFELPEVLWRMKEGKSPRVQTAVYNRDVQFDRYVASRLESHKDAKVFWGFQGSCHASLKSATALGMNTWCELATAHITAAQRILGEEARLQPLWAETIDNLVFPSHYQQRLEEEPHLASKVIAASQFTKSTLLEVGIKEKDVLVLPLGCDIDHVPYAEKEECDLQNRPLKVLYAGTITQRKGVSYLLEAIRELKTQIENRELEFHFIGGIQSNPDLLKPYSQWIHYHPPVSQQALFELYGTFDVLLLPTIFEGFGLVIVEAMAAGLPVITTPHSIGPELIDEGKNGYLIPIRDTAAIKNAVLKLRQLDNNAYLSMRRAARKAAEAYSWTAYQERLELLLTDQHIL